MKHSPIVPLGYLDIDGKHFESLENLSLHITFLGNVLANLSNVSKQIIKIKLELGKTHNITSGEDARQLVFDHCLQVTEYVRYNLNLYTWALRGFSKGKSAENAESSMSIQDFQKFLKTEIFQTFGDSVYVVDRILVHTLIHYPIEKLYYIIENFFFNMLQGLGETPARGFEALRNKIIDRLVLPIETKKPFRVFCLIRLSLHHNGVHEYSDEGPIDVRGIMFDFKQGKHVEYQDFSHLFILIEEIVENLKTITLHKDVLALKNIADRFISSIA